MLLSTQKKRSELAKTLKELSVLDAQKQFFDRKITQLERKVESLRRQAKSAGRDKLSMLEHEHRRIRAALALLHEKQDFIESERASIEEDHPFNLSPRHFRFWFRESNIKALMFQEQYYTAHQFYTRSNKKFPVSSLLLQDVYKVISDKLPIEKEILTINLLDALYPVYAFDSENVLKIRQCFRESFAISSDQMLCLNRFKKNLEGLDLPKPIRKILSKCLKRMKVVCNHFEKTPKWFEPGYPRFKGNEQHFFESYQSQLGSQWLGDHDFKEIAGDFLKTKNLMEQLARLLERKGNIIRSIKETSFLPEEMLVDPTQDKRKQLQKIDAQEAKLLHSLAITQGHLLKSAKAHPEYLSTIQEDWNEMTKGYNNYLPQVLLMLDFESILTPEPQNRGSLMTQNVVHSDQLAAWKNSAAEIPETSNDVSWAYRTPRKPQTQREMPPQSYTAEPGKAHWEGYAKPNQHVEQSLQLHNGKGVIKMRLR